MVLGSFNIQNTYFRLKSITDKILLLEIIKKVGRSPKLNILSEYLDGAECYHPEYIIRLTYLTFIGFLTLNLGLLVKLLFENKSYKKS